MPESAVQQLIFHFDKIKKMKCILKTIVYAEIIMWFTDLWIIKIFGKFCSAFAEG